MIDAYASEPHFLAHLVPVWRALAPELRGRFCVERALGDAADEAGLDPALRMPGTPVALVASYGDLRSVADTGRRAILCNHGAGQTYRPPHASYSGGPGRGAAICFLEPNARAAAASRIAYPRTPAIVVGSPKLDRWHARPAKPRENPPVVAVSWHWDAQHVPEMRSAWPHYRDSSVWERLAGRYQLLGHAHPRIRSEIEPWWEALGVEVAEDFDEVCARADVYVCDNSSTLFEFASLDRPVVVCNAPWYRRDVEHGLRFWEHADVGYQADEPAGLTQAISRALKDPPAQQQRRRRAVAAAYTHTDGRASGRAAAAIAELLATPEVQAIMTTQPRERVARSTVARRGTPAGRRAIRPPAGQTAQTHQPAPWRRQLLRRARA